MSAIVQYTDYLVLSLFTIVALGLLIFARRLHRENARKAQHSADELSLTYTDSAGSTLRNDAAAIKALLAQSLAGTQRAAQTIKETQARLEAVSARIERLEAQQAATGTGSAARVPERSTDVSR